MSFLPRKLLVSGDSNNRLDESFCYEMGKGFGKACLLDIFSAQNYAVLCLILSYEWKSFPSLLGVCSEVYNLEDSFYQLCCDSIRESSIGPPIDLLTCFPAEGPKTDDFFYTMPGEVENPGTWRAQFFTGYRKLLFSKKVEIRKQFLKKGCDRRMLINSGAGDVDSQSEDPDIEFSACKIVCISAESVEDNSLLISDEALEAILLSWPQSTASITDSCQLTTYESPSIPLDYESNIVKIYDLVPNEYTSKGIGEILNCIFDQMTDKPSWIHVHTREMIVEMPYEVYFFSFGKSQRQ